jgi:hypothetical protein
MIIIYVIIDIWILLLYYVTRKNKEFDKDYFVMLFWWTIVMYLMFHDLIYDFPP